MARMIIDTEATGPCNKALVYDLGGVVCDNNGDTLATFSWVIDDVFYGMPAKMASAYYADKLPQYHIEIANGSREVITLADAKERFAAICKAYNVKDVWAYNAKYDRDALIYTGMVCGVDHIIPENITVKCIMGAFLSTCLTGKYAACTERTNRGRIKCGAEAAYRFISGYTDFEESHTALADAEIEKIILFACLKKHKKMDTVPKSLMAFKQYHEFQKKYEAA